jgi:hypothetical protein
MKVCKKVKIIIIIARAVSKLIRCMNDYYRNNNKESIRSSEKELQPV